MDMAPSSVVEVHLGMAHAGVQLGTQVHPEITTSRVGVDLETTIRQRTIMDYATVPLDKHLIQWLYLVGIIATGLNLSREQPWARVIFELLVRWYIPIQVYHRLEE